MQSDQNDFAAGLDLTIHLDQNDATILFLLAIDSQQSLEDVLLGMMEDATSELETQAVQQPRVLRAMAEYKRTGQFDPTRWNE